MSEVPDYPPDTALAMADPDAVAADDMRDAENWTGRFYELILILGVADDARLDRAVGASAD